MDERPSHIEDRTQISHWEFYSIAGSSHASSSIMGVESESDFVVMALMDRPDAQGASKPMARLLKPIAHCVKTITADNGGEFALHELLDAQLGCTSYLCRPYAGLLQAASGAAMKTRIA